MEIVLLRHGRPRIDTRVRLSAAEFGLWVAAYDAAGLEAGSVPPRETMDIARTCDFVVCSHLPRALESVQALGLVATASDPLFRELDMPFTDWRLARLPPQAWAVMFRLLWAAGYSAYAESFTDGRKRARHCAGRLVELAEQHGKVLFVGHGTLNWFVARQLRKMGWSGPEKAPRRHWEFGVYRSPIRR